MSQLSFFEARPLARVSDPVTSHDAADKTGSFRVKHEALIYDAICKAGWRGATMKEIAKATGLESVQVGRRLSAMGVRGVITRVPCTDASGVEARDGCAVWFKK